MDNNLYFDLMNRLISEMSQDLATLPLAHNRNERELLDNVNSKLNILRNGLAFLKENTQAAIVIQQEVPLKTFTLEQLATNNGLNGNPAYVAVNGIVYDVTEQAVWAGATHFGLHAGTDQTAAFGACHGNYDILEQFPVVGKLV